MKRVQEWLRQPLRRATLPRDRLETRIVQFLMTQNMCVLATQSPAGPLATPIEFYADGLTLYMLGDPNTPKLRNIERDPRVCVAVFAPYVGWGSARGAQIFGTARIFQSGTPEYEAGLEVYRWEAAAAALGRDAPPTIPMIRVDPTRISYTESWLRAEGYAPRQIWRASDLEESRRG